MDGTANVMARLAVKQQLVALPITAQGRPTASNPVDDNQGVDVVVMALARLVKERWANERQEREAVRSRLTMIEGERKR